MARIAPIRPPYQKATDAKCQAIRDSAKGETCTLRLECCNGDPSTTVWAHLQFFAWSGMAMKGDDLLGVYACSTCHDSLDGRITTDFWGFDDVLRALGESLLRLKAKGLLHVGRKSASADSADGGQSPVVTPSVHEQER